MKYSIAYLIKGNVEEYQRKIMKEFSEIFDIRDLNNHIPPHITFKAPFETENVKELEELVANFCKNNKASKIKIGELGHFDNRVIYLDTKFSSDARIVYNNFIKELEKIEWISWREHDKLGNFHATLTYCQNENEYNEFWEYFSKLKTASFDLKLDNLAILVKNDEGDWEVYKEFKIK
jgi:2'-5' RNA ligase